MKSTFIVFAFIFLIAYNSIAQNPLGIYLDIDGKVKFWESEANRNGNLDDTVYVTFSGEKQLMDLRNLKYDHLTFLEAPRGFATSSCNLDPSRVNDTTRSYDSENQINSTNFIFDINQALFILEYTKLDDTSKISSEQNQFLDDIRGDGLNDSTIKEVKEILLEYINRYTGKWEPYEAREELQSKLSTPDTVIEQKAVYDYLVDLFVAYNYDKMNRLTKVIGYHCSLGVEVDSLNYDLTGKLIYFSRDKIGSIRNEFFFEYNDYNQVSNVIYIYSTVGTNRDTPQYTNPQIQKMKFTYNPEGIMNSQSQLQKDGNWLTTYYEIK